MAKPSGWDSAAASGSQHKSSDDQILMSWYSDEHPTATDNRVTQQLSFDTSDPNMARQRALDEFLQSKRTEIRQARMNEDPAPKRDVMAPTTQALLTNLELTNNNAKPVEVKAPEKQTTQTGSDPRDLGFAAIRQLEGPSSSSSKWMAANRPDLMNQFQSQECSLQIGSKPDGTVWEVLTSPQGFSRMLTAKGSTTVEIIADRQGNELFKNSSRSATTQSHVLSA
jgi:hypothetical protein